jgi:pimeloyl-ACP methyl ester carboxylesterase
MHHYADDLADRIETLDLHDAVLVGHSTGGGDITRYIGRHGTTRVAKVVLAGAVPPLMLKTATNPGGLPLPDACEPARDRAGAGDRRRDVAGRGDFRQAAARCLRPFQAWEMGSVRRHDFI